MDELTTPTLPWWRRLVVQLVALVLAAAFLPLLIVGIETIQTERARAIQQARQANLAQAEGIAERVASHVRQAAAELKVLAGSPPLRSGDWDAAWVELERLQSQYPYLAVLTLTDTAGNERVKVSATELVLPGSLGSSAQSPDFLAAMRGETYLGDLQFVTGAGQRLPVSVPVFDAARQEVIGVLSAELALRDLLETVGTTRAGQAGYAYIVDDGGRIVAHPDFSLVLAQADASAIPETQDFLAGLQEWQEPEFSAYDSLAGEPVFGVHAPIGAPNWSVTVEQPAAEVLVPVQALTLQFAFLWGVTMLLAAGLAVALTLFVARPVSQLTWTAQRLAAGDRSARVPVGRQDEVGLLATSFNHMVESVQQAESQRDATLEALRESEERFRSVYSQSPIGIELYDSKGSLIDVNPECLDIFGVRSVEAVKGFDLFEDPNLSDEAKRRIIDGEPVKYESEFDFDIVKEMALYETTKSGKCYLDVLITPWDVRKQDQKGFLVHVQDITGRKQAEGALRQYTERLRILREIDQAILAAQSPEDIAQAAMAHVRELVPCQRASVTTFDLEAEAAIVLAVHTNGETVMEVGVQVPLGTFGLTGELERGQAHTVDDLRTVSTPSPMGQMLLTGGIRSYVNVPLVAQGELIGALNLGAGEPAAFGKQQIEIAREVADQLAIAIRQARLYEASQRQSEELATLLEVSQGLAVTLDLGTVLQTAIEGAVQVMGLGSGAIYLLEGEELYLGATTPPLDPQAPESIHRAPLADHPHIQESVSTNLPVLLPDTATADLSPAERAISEARGLRSVLYVPLLVGERAVGTLILATTGEPRGFSEAEIDLSRTLSNQVALAIGRARLYESVQRHAAELEGRVAERTTELSQRVAEVESLNRAMTNLLNDLQAANRRLAETGQELQRANAELETFTYSVSHDLKGPLRGIDGYSRLLLEDHANQLDDEGRTFLHTIRHAAEQMNQLIDDLLAYSRLERRAMHTTSVDPRALVESLVAEYAEEIHECGVGLTVEVPCGTVLAEAEGLAQALRNLLDNALKFTRDAPEPRVEIGGRDTEKTCIIWVRDNGIGFDMLYHDRIFEIFQRLHRAEEYPGTGVGLAIVRKAMQRMDGRVWAESTPGEGATFYLEIPR